MSAKTDAGAVGQAVASALGIWSLRSSSTPRAENKRERAPLHPKVVAKLTRRQFTAVYRLRIAMEAALDWKKNPPRCTRSCMYGENIRATGTEPQECGKLLPAPKSLDCTSVLRVLGVPRLTFYRPHSCAPGRQPPRPTPSSSLCEGERKRLLETLASRRLADCSSAEVVATLLDEGQTFH